MVYSQYIFHPCIYISGRYMFIGLGCSFNFIFDKGFATQRMRIEMYARIILSAVTWSLLQKAIAKLHFPTKTKLKRIKIYKNNFEGTMNNDEVSETDCRDFSWINHAVTPANNLFDPPAAGYDTGLSRCFALMILNPLPEQWHYLNFQKNWN